MPDFDWNTEEKDATQAAILECNRMGLDSFHDLLQIDPSLQDKPVKLIHTAIDDLQDISPHVIGVINEHEGETWVFFQPNDDIFKGADAIPVRLVKPELGDRDPDNIQICHDIWCIISKEPLLIRSMYGAILGFKKTVEGVVCHTVVESDADDWGFEG
jgi:hypothetical protein